MGELTGQAAIVTGGASGIGRAAAASLAAAGAVVAIVDVDGSAAAGAADELRAAGATAHVVEADLADPVAAATVVERAGAALGRVDILVNGAGIGGRRSLLDTDVDGWARVHAVNLTAPFVLLRDSAAVMIEQGDGGRIVNVSSSSAFRAAMMAPSYASSKAGLLGLTRSAAAELGPTAST